ncbi:MAG TPA: Rieske 2Fe-2S domain-containing protein, partial [Gammaproteobacteria bacterium]|nr:Rieske 2Fe-2S domain-containing protein [Gammaproteobacteria bacterium]
VMREYGRKLKSVAEYGQFDAIAPGHGAIVQDRGGKLAAWRDENGKLTLLSASCTHLHCDVQWNAAEKTWDCPCHGSRFSVHGDVIEGPALAPLAPHKVERKRA